MFTALTLTHLFFMSGSQLLRLFLFLRSMDRRKEQKKSDGFIVIGQLYFSFFRSYRAASCFCSCFTGFAWFNVAHLRVRFDSGFALVARSFSMTYRSSTYRRPTEVNKVWTTLKRKEAILFAPFYSRL